MIERVCVIGAGSIGSLFAGHLAQVAKVSVLTRRAEHAEALNREGLHVTGRSDLHAAVTAAADPDELEPFDLGIIATKANGLEKAASSLEGRFPGAMLMTTLNGLGAEDVVRDHGDWPIISAVTFMTGTKHSDTEVEYVLDTATWMGPYQDTPLERVEEVGELMRRSGLKAEVFADLKPALWSKLIFNSTINAVAALTGLRHDHHFGDEDEPTDLGHLVHDLIEEGKGVARAAGIELYEDPWEMNVHATKRGSAHYPSMLEDVEARRPTEIDLITGSLVREAGKHGVPVPLHTAMYRLVKAKEASWREAESNRQAHQEA